MAGAERRLRLKVYLDESQKVAEIFVTQVTKCKDIVQRLQRQIQETDCYLIEVWQGCERLVPDSESIFSTLLEWGSDLEDVKFYLRPREEIPSYSQAVNGSTSQRVNGFKEETPLSRDVLLGGSRISISELKEFAARQQQEIAAKEKELKAKQVQFMEMRRKLQNKPQNPSVQQLSAKADEQEQRLRELRHAQDQTDSYKLSNGALAEELENVRSHFMEKEKELAIAVARVESLTRQLDKQRKGWSQATPSRQKTHQELELERLRKELMTRNELNHQQSVQIQSQKQLLAEKHKELFELESQIDRHSNILRNKRSQGNHIAASDHHVVNGVTSSTDEPDFLEMDYSSLRTFSKRQHKTNNAESKSGTGNSATTSGSFRRRGRNGRKLETLLEVEEEVSDGHASNKSSTEDLTQGPGPPRASRVTELKSRFEAEGVTSAKMVNHRSPSPARRVDPEGVETPPKMAGVDGLHSVSENRYYNGSDLFDYSSLKSRPSHVNEEEQISTSKEEALEVSPSSEAKPELAHNGTECSSPSDGEDFSGHSSPLSVASSSSSSSNSSTSKAAVFAITGVVKKTGNFAPQSEKPQSQYSESFSPQRFPQGLSYSNKFENSRAQPEQPVGDVLTPKSDDGDFPLQARLVKSEGFSTKNENIGTSAQPTVLDFSRSRMKPQQPIHESVQNNQMNGRKVEQKFSSPPEVKSLATKLEQFNARSAKPATGAQIGSDRGNVSKRTELKSTDSSVKSGKIQLSRLRYSTGTSVNSALPQQIVMESSESEKNVKDLSSKRNKETALMDASGANRMENSSHASLQRLSQNSIQTNGHAEKEDSVASINDFGRSSEKERSEKTSNRNDETDSSRMFYEKQNNDILPVDDTQTPPLVFRPISYRAKKSAGLQSSVSTSADRSELGSAISNSVSIRGNSSSLTKITVTPSASYYNARDSNIPEQRSPVPTSKRSRFMFHSVTPTSSEGDTLLGGTFNEQERKEFGDNGNLDKETGLTNTQIDNKTRGNTDALLNSKQVVSSFNIQLSSRSQKWKQGLEEISSPEKISKSDQGKENNESSELVSSRRKIFEGKELIVESGRPSSKNEQTNSERDRVPPEIGPFYHDNGNLKPESGRLSFGVGKPDVESLRLSRKGESEETNENTPIDLSSELSISPNANLPDVTRVGFQKSQLEQARFSKTTLSSSEDGIHGFNAELRPKDSHDKNDTLSGTNQGLRDLETKDRVTVQDFPVDINNINTVTPLSVNGDIRLGSQSNNSLSELVQDKRNIDDTSKFALVNGDVLKNSPENLSSGFTESAATSAQKISKKKKPRRVSLDPYAVLLDAAVEGELDLVKLVVREVDDPSEPNNDGITALHNAVCASHDEVVKFLVEFGVDINCPDSHGWTPLHCAAANNATEMARFLTEHGACIFAATSLEKKTPMQCCERGVPDYFSCMKYLNDVQENFGLVNDGRVYALYTYTAEKDDELSFECGEELLVLTRGDETEKEWWWARNNREETGYIPRNLLGLRPRISPV